MSSLLPDDVRDLVVAVVEDIVEQEDGTLDRGEPFEQQQEGHRERVGVLGVLRGIRAARIGQERLGQPLADVALLAHPGRSQVVDREPRGDRRQVGLGRLDLRTLLDECVLVAQERVLDDVLGLGDAPQHPVGNREEQRAQILERLGHELPPARRLRLHVPVDEEG